MSGLINLLFFFNFKEKPLPCRCIGVFGLNVYTTQQKIREIFAKYGPIERIQVITDAQVILIFLAS